MKIKIEGVQELFPLLFKRAKQSFEKCINNPDNAYLKNEVNIPLHDIVIIENNIKIVFSGPDFEQYLFESNLILSDGHTTIGKYTYIQNKQEEVIDDFLVFY